MAYTKTYAASLGLGCDFTFGTLWPFGGSFVENKYSVKKFGEALCQQRQEKSWEYPVKGYVLNHMDKDALFFYAEKMLSGLAEAMMLGRSGWFCDSKKTFDVPLVFEPYQSILIRIDKNQSLLFEDITFIPGAPKKLHSN